MSLQKKKKKQQGSVITGVIESHISRATALPCTIIIIAKVFFFSYAYLVSSINLLKDDIQFMCVHLESQQLTQLLLVLLINENWRLASYMCLDSSTFYFFSFLYLRSSYFIQQLMPRYVSSFYILRAFECRWISSKAT